MNRIFKMILLLFLLIQGAAVFSQEVEIKKSEDVIVLQGKSFYLHTVMPGQTLFSICKAYGVSVAEVKTLNKKGEEALRLYEVLRIPYVEPFVQQDDKFYYHKVQQGETLYSIARMYDIKPKRLMRFNDEIEKKTLAVGSVVRLPLKEITLPKRETTVAETVVYKDELEQLTQDSLDSHKMRQEELMTNVAKIETATGDTLPIPSREVAFEQILQSGGMVGDSTIRVALLLPLAASAYPVYQDSLLDEGVEVSARSEQFLSFYEGMLLAVDTLKSCGYEIDLHVYDTERSGEKAHAIAQELNQIQPDLIVGPVYASVYKVLADQLTNKNIPLIYPLSTRGEEFGACPNFVQVNASLDLTVDYMLQWLDTLRLNANVLYLDVKGGRDPESLTRIQFKDRLLRMEGVRSHIWDMENVPVDSLHVLFVPERENIVIVPEDKEGEVTKVLSQLSALTNDFQLTVLGLPEWQAFSSIDHETFFKLNTKLFTYSYVDYSLDAVKRVAENYRKYFSTEPNTLVFKAFDMGIYFMKLVAQYRERTLEALEFTPGTIGSSQFRFKTIPNQAGKENNGFYIVNFGSDYQLKVFNF